MVISTGGAEGGALGWAYEAHNQEKCGTGKASSQDTGPSADPSLVWMYSVWTQGETGLRGRGLPLPTPTVAPSASLGRCDHVRWAVARTTGHRQDR